MTETSHTPADSRALRELDGLEYAGRRKPGRPTKAIPGTPDHLEVLEGRARRHEDMRHEGDAPIGERCVIDQQAEDLHIHRGSNSVALATLKPVEEKDYRRRKAAGWVRQQMAANEDEMDRVAWSYRRGTPEYCDRMARDSALAEKGKDKAPWYTGPTPWVDEEAELAAEEPTGPRLFSPDGKVA